MVLESVLEALLGSLSGFRLEGSGANAKVVEMSTSWFQSALFGITKNKQNAKDILQKCIINWKGHQDVEIVRQGS